MPCGLTLGPERHALLDLGALARLAVMLVPSGRGTFRQQAEELFAQLVCIMSHQATPLTPTTMMVFLKDAGDERECREVIQRRFGDVQPVINFVAQPPCCGAALGVELWALGGTGVQVRRYNPHLITVESDGIRWIHCGGVRGGRDSEGAHGEAISAFRQLEQHLAMAGAGFEDVVRTWIYVNQITEGPDGRQRYQELNRARTDFFADVGLCGTMRAPWAPEKIYPASTGIGTQGGDIVMSCMALASERPDVFVMPLENPQQTAAYNYDQVYSPKTPKFSRAMAVVQGHFTATLVSGTASIVNAVTMHPGDVVKQTAQTIENIEKLIAPGNFARHGLAGGGATLKDIAKLRVYVKHAADYERCRACCEERLPGVPAIYLHADVCRPDLLVEIEAVAFSPFRPGQTLRRPGGTGANGSAMRAP
jgi:enamine deaminase RidA (YjgF/YER057c/UK114 family)